MRTCLSTFLLIALAASCTPRSEPPPSDAGAQGSEAPSRSIVDREWSLVQIGENSNPLGNGGNPVTLTFQSSDGRAFGNAGCNRYSGPYTLSGSSLTFGPAVSTKMACEQGTDVEIAFLSMLNGVRSYQATDSSLTLVGESGPLARFR